VFVVMYIIHVWTCKPAGGEAVGVINEMPTWPMWTRPLII
jgi:hypothetical protein